MKKQEMIREIQMTEAKLWKNLSWCKAEFGVMSPEAKRARTAWQSVFDLRERMGIDCLPIAELIANDLLPGI